MIDTINPMNFDITKNLHGHVRVETRDRWTGRVVDSQEKDNLVTNAVQELVMAQAWAASGSTMYSDILPLQSNALGGLFLFGGTLTEAATNTGFPSNVSLVGCAGQTADTSNPIKGSYNGQESIYTSTGFTTVWDFGTSQANGTIASLARTSARFVNSALWDERTSLIEGSGSYAIPATNAFNYLGYDKTNQYLYIGMVNNVTLEGVNYLTTNIYRTKINLYAMGIKSTLLPASTWTLVKTLTSSDGSVRSTDFLYDKYDNNFVYITGTTIHLIAVDGTHTTKTAANTSGAFCATENYYWRINGTTAYCIQKSNTSNIQGFTLSGTLNYPFLIPVENDIAITAGMRGGNPATMVVLYPDGTATPIPGATTSFGTNDSPTWANSVGQFITAHSSYLKVPSCYLGTIVNLDSPVTKTSSQTMKITYTLTEA